MIAHLAVPTWLAAVLLLAVAGLALAVVALAGSLRAQRRRTQALLEQAAVDAEELRTQLAGIERQLADAASVPDPRAPRSPVRADGREYVITDLGTSSTEAVPALPAPVFVDVLLRESMIRTVSLAAGLRRALAPEVRNRIRFEMRREVRRARKQRRTDLRTARREFEARQRAGMEPTG
ncbi:hypothetical protein [Nocardioides sambongensis]|uniref:hypothetical protein n=1 Tax=Nocardioides sambongensis TaxID=2589074 RepID=UPI0011261E5C|nr:hypothetical protein [Nocardioides sambongensis]